MISILGVSVGAISGALEARNKRMDIFGAVVVALVTALGGGTLRDRLLQHGPVFWIADSAPLLTAVAMGILTFIAASSPGKSFRKALLIADAGALALFTIIGTERAVAAGAGPAAALLMGVITGVAGGILRDILCNEIPLVLRRDVYATASIVGASLFLILTRAHVHHSIASVIGIVVVFGIRLAVLRWKLALPEKLQAPPAV